LSYLDCRTSCSFTSRTGCDT